MSDTSPTQIITRHLLIQGRVQGVGYRYVTRREAERLGLTGWIRNRRDGNVEAVVSGPAEAVFQLIEWCNSGPPAARVNRVDATPAEMPDGDGSFEIRPTA